MKLSLARTHFPFVATFVLGLAFAAFFIETVKLGSRQEPIFTTEDVLAMRMEVRQHSVTMYTHARSLPCFTRTRARPTCVIVPPSLSRALVSSDDVCRSRPRSVRPMEHSYA